MGRPILAAMQAGNRGRSSRGSRSEGSRRRRVKAQKKEPPPSVSPTGFSLLISGGLSDNPPILCAPITSASRTYRPQYYQYWRPFEVALDRRWANVLPTDAQISEPTDTYSRATFAPTALYAAGAKFDPLGRSTLSGATRHLTQLRGSGDRTRSDLFVLSAESEGDANFSMIVGEIPRYGMCKICTQQKAAPIFPSAALCSCLYGGRWRE